MYVQFVCSAMVHEQSRERQTHLFEDEHLGSYPGLSRMPFKLYYVLVVIGCDFLQPIKQETTSQNVNERPTRMSRTKLRKVIDS